MPFIAFFLSEHRQQNEVEQGHLFHFIFTLYFLFISVSFPGLRITRIFWSLEICSNPCSVLTRKSLNTITDDLDRGFADFFLVLLDNLSFQNDGWIRK